MHCWYGGHSPLVEFLQLSMCDLAAGSERQMILEMDPCRDLVRRNAIGEEVGQLRCRNDLPWSGQDERDRNLTFVRIWCADHGRHRDRRVQVERSFHLSWGDLG